jgi:hypothetical protein
MASMGRYKTEHTTVDVSIIPFIPMIAKKTVITDIQTRQRAEGLDWSSYRASDQKAWEKLHRGDR